MAKKLPPQKSILELKSTLEDLRFAMAEDPNFAGLIAPLGSLPVESDQFDFAYVATNASTPGIIRIGDDLEALNGIIATGNGKDDIDLSNSTGNNLVHAGNGIDKVTGGEGDDTVFGGNGNDNLVGGEGADSLEGGNGVDVLDGGAGNDTLMGGSAKDTLTGGTDEGTATVTFTATDSGGAVTVLDANVTVLAEGANLTTQSGGSPNELVQLGVFVDTASSPDLIYQVFGFTPDDPAPPGSTTTFVVALYDSDGNLVGSPFNVDMTEGEQNLFSVAGNDGGTVAVFADGTLVDPTLAEAQDDLIVQLDYESVAVAIDSVEIEPGDVLYGGAGLDLFVYNSGDGVDAIHDYKKGDVIQLNGIDPSNVTTIVEGGSTFLLFSDGAGDIATNSAIELVGVTGQVNLTFA